jgi:hypothetical protein
VSSCLGCLKSFWYFRGCPGFLRDHASKLLRITRSTVPDVYRPMFHPFVMFSKLRDNTNAHNSEKGVPSYLADDMKHAHADTAI